MWVIYGSKVLAVGDHPCIGNQPIQRGHDRFYQVESCQKVNLMRSYLLRPIIIPCFVVLSVEQLE